MKYLYLLSFSLLLISIPTANAVVEISDGTVLSYWGLNSTSSDSVGSVHGTPTGITWATSTCVIDECAEFGTKIDFGANYGFVWNASTSWNFWIKDSSQVNFEVVMGRSTDPLSVSNHGWGLFYGSGKGQYVNMSAGSSGNALQTQKTMDISTDGAWHMVTVTKAGEDASDIKWYLDGVEVATSATTDYDTLSATPSYSTNLIWGQSGAGSRQFTGALDEVMYVDRVLTQQEITDLYNGGSGDTVCITENCGGNAPVLDDPTNLEIGLTILFGLSILSFVLNEFKTKKELKWT